MRTILLSFESIWFDKLENGETKFEYRKMLPSDAVTVSLRHINFNTD